MKSTQTEGDSGEILAVLTVAHEICFSFRYNIQYPALYASESDPQGKMFNCKCFVRRITVPSNNHV